MDTPKYAILENERRFLVDPARLPDLAGAGFRLIEDLYVDGSCLRLRAMTDSATGERQLKFCKKYGSDDPVSGPIVNIYLSPEEYALLSALPGARLRKRRYRAEHDGQTFGVDVFEGELDGLVLCEKEAATADLARAIQAPPWASRDVTADPFFTGGALSRLSARDLKARLREIGRR